MTSTATQQANNHYLMWFRRDLRIHDNTALSAICQQAKHDNATVTALFIITPQQWLIHHQSITLVDHLLRTLPILATDLAKQLNIELHIKITDTYNNLAIQLLQSLDKSLSDFIRSGNR